MISLIKYTYWSSLYYISVQKATQYAILVPIIGYMILLNENFLSFLTLASDGLWATSENIDEGVITVSEYRMFFTYYGISVMALTAMIVRTLTPESIKGKLEQERLNATPLMFTEQIASLLRERNNGDPRVAEFRLSLQESGVIVSDLTPGTILPIENPNQRVRLAYTELNDTLVDQSFPLMRLILSFSFVLGAALAAIPPADTFFRVTAALLQKMSG